MASDPIPINETGTQRTVFAIRTLLIGLEFDESTHGELLCGMALVLGLRIIGVDRDDPDAPTRYRIEAL